VELDTIEKAKQAMTSDDAMKGHKIKSFNGKS
jgi:hypothetical protein